MASNTTKNVINKIELAILGMLFYSSEIWVGDLLPELKDRFQIDITQKYLYTLLNRIEKKDYIFSKRKGLIHTDIRYKYVMITDEGKKFVTDSRSLLEPQAPPNTPRSDNIISEISLSFETNLSKLIEKVITRNFYDLREFIPEREKKRIRGVTKKIIGIFQGLSEKP